MHLADAFIQMLYIFILFLFISNVIRYITHFR